MADHPDDPLAQVKAMRQAQLRACALKQAQELNQLLKTETGPGREASGAEPDKRPPDADPQP